MFYRSCILLWLVDSGGSFALEGLSGRVAIFTYFGLVLYGIIVKNDYPQTAS